MTSTDKVEVGQFYKHYKGDKYQVICLSKWSGASYNDILVTYKNVKSGEIYTDALNKFIEPVPVVCEIPGIFVKRFTLCENTYTQ